MSAVPVDVSLHNTLRRAKTKGTTQYRFTIYKWGEGWGSTDPLPNRGHHSHRWMAGNLSKWWDKICFGDEWTTAQSGIICTHVSTTECPLFPLFCLFFFSSRVIRRDKTINITLKIHLWYTWHYTFIYILGNIFTCFPAKSYMRRSMQFSYLSITYERHIIHLQATLKLTI